MKRRENIVCHGKYLENFNTTSQIDVSKGRQSPELIWVGCEVKVRIWGQITDYMFYLQTRALPHIEGSSQLCWIIKE